MKLRALLFGLLLAGAARAEPILASDPALEALAAGYERQQDTFARSESGQNLDAFIKPADMALVTAFFTQGADFQAFAKKHAFAVIESFDEHGDMGNFSGIASVGLAARLMVLRRDAAPPAEIARARDACVRAARTWHVFGTIAGPGTIARGVRRVTPLSGEPALPGVVPPLVPLKDGSGAALPSPKGDAWRAPIAPGFDGWIWRDNTRARRPVAVGGPAVREAEEVEGCSRRPGRRGILRACARGCCRSSCSFWLPASSPATVDPCSSRSRCASRPGLATATRWRSS